MYTVNVPKRNVLVDSVKCMWVSELLSTKHYYIFSVLEITAEPLSTKHYYIFSVLQITAERTESLVKGVSVYTLKIRQ